MNRIEEAPLSPKSSTDNSDSHQETKIVEAKTAILLDQGSPIVTHNDSIQWLLVHLFRPLTTRTYQGHSLLHLSANSKPIWEHTLDRHETDNLTLAPSLSITTGLDSSLDTMTPDSNATSSPSKLYILTPRTHILSVANNYSMVYMVDLSSSLATIDMLRGHIMIENAFDLLANMILGIVRPFSLSLPSGTSILFEPTICITVIAECSQFGSNINVIPILAEYPTMRVLLQNVNINTSNVYAVLQTLSNEVKSFQYDLGKFRQQIAQRRSKLGYQLDVRYDHSSLVEEGETEYDVGTVDTTPIKPSGTLKTASVNVKTPTSPSTLSKKTMKKGTKATKRTAPKANGALRRSPMAAEPQMEQHQEEQQQDQEQENHHHQQQQQQQQQQRTRQQRAKGMNSWKKDVWGVGKTGSNLSYILRAGAFALTLLPPNGRRSIVLLTDGVVKSNVDESVLRQLSCDNIACHVVHIGVEDGFTPGCNFGFVPDTEILQFVTNATGGHFTHSSQNPSILTDITTIDSIPNIYHLRFLCREIVLEKVRSDNRLLHTTGSFPWTTNILPVPVEVRLMRYQEYYLPKQVWLVIGARIRQGFSLASVVFDDSTQRKGHPTTQDHHNTPKKERVTIILVLQWQPHVAVEYRIRAYWSTTWTPLLQQHLPSLTQPQQMDYKNTAQDTSRHGIYNGMISPKAEILIRANHTFSEMLKNWDMFQRRMQMMGVVNGGAGMELAGSTAGFSKVGKLKKLLDRIFESDNMLKAVMAPSSSNVDFKSAWLTIHNSDLRPYTRYWYDEQSFDIITTLVEPTHDALHARLDAWATFTHKDQVYVKVLDNDDDNGQIKESTHPRYCELRTFKEKTRIMMVRILFFGTSTTQRQHIVDELKNLLATEDDLTQLAIRHPSDQSLCHVAQRPLSSLLMRDPEHYMVHDIEQQQIQMNMWYGNATLWVTGEYIVRNYLYHNTIHWDLQDHGVTTLTPVLDLAYDFMCRVRMEQGYIVLSSHQNGCHFYKEVHDTRSVFAVQYYIWKDPVKKEIVTELWMEPSSLDRKAHKLVESEMTKVDKDILTRLVTFEHVAALGHSCRLNDLSTNDRSSTDKLLNTQHVRQHHLFDLSSILRLGTFWLTSYPCPTFIGHDEQNATDKLSNTMEYPALGHEIWKTDKNTNCTCARSDALFYQHRNAISALSPQHRDMVFLHYFIERSLGLAADDKVCLDKTTRDDFWPTLLDLLAGQNIDFGHLGPSIHDYSCFVQSSHPTVITLVLLPSFETVIKAPRLDNSVMGIMMFECHRQSLGSETTATGSGLILQACDLQPVFSKGTWQGSFGGDWTPPEESTVLAHLQSQITHIYCASFVKSIFTSLLHGRVVASDDFDKVLGYCRESTLDIDITGYLNVQTLLERRKRVSKEEIELAHQRFVSVLGHYFEPVVTTKGQHQNIYCYRPPFTKAGQKLGFSLLGQKPTNLADVVECAQNPLFLRLECVLKKPGEATTTFTFDQIPSSYGDSGFEPQEIGTEESPVASTDGTSATLRLVCLTLPSFDNEPAQKMPHTHDCPATSVTMHHQPVSFLESQHAQRETLSSLNPDKQDALLETESRLVWLFTEEIMHGLLRSGPITPPVLRYVESQLKKKNPFVDFPTTMFIPLVFVKNQQQSRDTFFTELEKAATTPYRLVRVGDAFYASDEQDDLRSPLYQPHYDIEGLNISIDVPFSPTTKTNAGSDDYCQGLGISLLDETMDDQRSDTSDDDDLLQKKQQLYWLLLIPQKQSVQIYFYSKLQQSVNRSEIIRMTKTMVNEVMERTNKLVLLQSMHDSRICSKYLLAPSDESEREQYSSSDDLDSDDFDTKGFGTSDNLVEILSTSGEELALTPPKKFQPGQFGCDILLTKRFPLHWRLQPNSALTILSNEVLRPFAVKNRPNMFVIMRDNVVVYCFLSEGVTTHAFDSESQNDNESLYLRPGSPGYYSLQPMESNGEVPHKLHNASFSSFVSTTSPHGSPHSSTTKSSPGRPSPSIKKRYIESRELLFEVHGVEFGGWISELVEMLSSRLESQIIMKEVQQFLTRNPTSKLSRADLEFILPVTKDPTLRRTLRITPVISNPLHFLALLRQNILVGPLRALDGTDIASLVRRHRMLRYGSYSGGLSWSQSNSSPGVNDRQVQDLCFYYSCTSRTPGLCSPFELSVGQGVAGICLSLLDKHGTFVTHLPKTKSTSIDDLQLEAYLNDDYLMGGMEDGYMLGIDIWPIGQIEGDFLLHYIYDCFKHTICDYIVEQVIQTALTEPILVENQESASINHFDDTWSIKAISTPFLQVLDKAIEWQSPTVKQLSWSTRLAPWCMDDVLLQLEGELNGINPLLKPIITCAPLSCDLMMENELLGEHTLYDPQLGGDAQNNQYMVISGLPELGITSGFSSRRHSTESYWSQNKKWKDEDYGKHHRQDSVASSMSKSGVVLKQKLNYKEADHHHCFMLLMIDCVKTTMYAYNCTEAFTDQVSQLVLRTLAVQESRHLALENIVHQKMGLFHHTHTMASILSTCSSVSMQSSSAHPSLSAIINNQQQEIQPSSSPNASSIARLAQVEPRTRSTSMEKVQVNFTSLKQLVTNTFSSKTRPDQPRLSSFYSDTDTSIFDVEEHGKLCNEDDDVVYTAVRMADANSVFRDAFATTEYAYANHRDYLIRHGEPFLNMYLNRSKLQAAHEKAFKVYSKWADRSIKKEDEMITVSELGVILKASRILHFCRTPLFLSDIDSTETVNFGSNHLQKTARLFDQTDDTQTKWYEHLTRTFMKEYASYLSSIGMHFIGPAHDDSLLSKFNISPTQTVTCPVTFFLKVYNGGTVLCETRLTGVFVSVTLYTLHRRYGRRTLSPYTHEKHENSQAGFHDFTKECDGLKQKIHVNSFVSDFRLRFLLASLEDRGLENTPPRLNLMNMMDNMVALHGKRPGGYSRNRIVHGSYTMPLDGESTLEALVPTLLKNASDFGLTPLVYDQVTVGCFVASDDISFELGHDDSRLPFRYALVITQATTSTEKITLNYNVIVTYQGIYRRPMAWRSVVKQVPERYENILDEVLLPDRYSLNQVLQHAKRRIDTLVKQAATACHRDADWNRLYQAIHTKQDVEETKLVRQFETLIIDHDTDPALTRLLTLKLRWNSVIDVIKLFHPLTSGELGGSLVVFVPNAVMEYFVLMELSDDNQLLVYCCSKHKRRHPNQLDDVEKLFLGNLATILGYHLWKCTK